MNGLAAVHGEKKRRYFNGLGKFKFETRSDFHAGFPGTEKVKRFCRRPPDIDERRCNSK
jgi:hypothetical protein